MKIEPYLVFEGRCEEAVEFYKKTLGAEVTMLMRMKDNPEPNAQGPGCAPSGANAEKIMHAELNIAGNTVMCSDGMMQEQSAFKGFALSITVPDEATAKQFYEALGDGGQPFMPLAKTFWSPCFGMVNDRFGVCWMVGMNPQ